MAIMAHEDTVFHAADAHDDLCWSPYDGETFRGRVTTTFLRGMKVWDNATILGAPGDGRFVARAPL
jgi:allantoinase